MFVSPCILRSTQCAALIALAAVAGIARTETTSPIASSESDPQMVAQNWQAGQPARPGFTFASFEDSPWLRLTTHLALRLLGRHHRAGSDQSPNACSPASADVAPTAAQGTCALPVLCSVDAAGAPYFSTPRALTRSRPHLIPFAVGPPPGLVTFTPFAAGTSVPGNSTANRKSERASRAQLRVAHVDDESSGVRSTHPLPPSPFGSGPSFERPFALRGEPAFLRFALRWMTASPSPAAA